MRLIATQNTNNPSHEEVCSWLDDLVFESFPQTKLTDGYAGANQERDAKSQARDQCRRELRLGHPCGQVRS